MWLHLYIRRICWQAMTSASVAASIWTPILLDLCRLAPRDAERKYYVGNCLSKKALVRSSSCRLRYDLSARCICSEIFTTASTAIVPSGNTSSYISSTGVLVRVAACAGPPCFLLNFVRPCCAAGKKHRGNSDERKQADYANSRTRNCA